VLQQAKRTNGTLVSEVKQKGETMQYKQKNVAAFCIGVQQQ
jgi:hypothetical protein